MYPITHTVVVMHMQGRVQDLTKGGTHAHAQIIDGCGLSCIICTCLPTMYRITHTLIVMRMYICIVHTLRLYHPGSGRTYHEAFGPPKVPMKDDVRTCTCML